MEWTDNDRKLLLDFKYNQDCDDIKVKEIVKKELLKNRAIIHVLNNKELEDAEAEADEYFNTNILPFYLISPTQYKVQNFICFEVSYDEAASYRYSKSHQSLNSTVKTLQLIFYVLCEQKTLIDKETGIARHDLLAALLKDQFNWVDKFGGTLMLVSNVPTTVDKEYACRTLVFEQTTDNNIVKTVDGQARLINKINCDNKWIDNNG